MKKRNRFPKGWDEARVRTVLEHYENQTDEEAVAEDEAAFRRRDQTVMVVPKQLVPAITRLITREETIAGRRRHKPMPPPPLPARSRRAAVPSARKERPPRRG